jgi:hypothetical protein
VEVFVNTGTFSPAQMVNDDPNGKDGTVFGVIFTVNVAGKAH